MLIEIRIPIEIGLINPEDIFNEIQGFELDPEYKPVSVKPSSSFPSMGFTETTNHVNNIEQVIILRGWVENSKINDIERQPNVIKVWKDAPIKPFNNCPVNHCDCQLNLAKGTLADICNYLGVNEIWNNGYKGKNIVIGIVDGGITALNRNPKGGEVAKIPNVIDGWPESDWGTTAKNWMDHGNMVATDFLAIAPESNIYDINLSHISENITDLIQGYISDAISGYDWAINRHRETGTPHILSNSWGIYEKNWDDDYATNPNHPFTRKVEEAIEEGILVLFAAGNCGDICPDQINCGDDKGPGKSIWGANGHNLVMTVGAVNINEQYLGYSSQGPASLDNNKPDFCSISNFKGYTDCDSGTSVACPIAAGIVALLKQVKLDYNQEKIKDAIIKTAKCIGSSGWNQYSGYGIIQAKSAFDYLKQIDH